MADPIVSVNPFDPSDVVFESPLADDRIISSVLDDAVRVQPSWSSDAMLRSAALTALGAAIQARKQDFVSLMVREVGKPHGEADGEVERALAILRYYSQVALDENGATYPGSTPGAQVLVRRESLGVVLAICPWNFPLAIPLWKTAPALAYGNAVVIKPASPAIATGALLQDCVNETLPDGVLTQLVMNGSGTGELLDDQRIAAATFTGSTEVGLSVAERLARRAAPAQAEMGGQNPAIVLADADLDAAADAIIAGAMSYSGQKCTATRRVIVQVEIADALKERLCQRVKALEVGDPRLEGISVGPLISRSALEDFDDARSDALKAGGELLAEAAILGGDGYFVPPTLIEQNDPFAKVNQEETFGPLLTVLTVTGVDAAVAAANSTRFGLVGAVHGRDLEKAVSVASRLECGLRRINAPTPGVDFYAPFGGNGFSSFGPREQGRAAREFFTTTTTMTVVPSAKHS